MSRRSREAARVERAALSAYRPPEAAREPRWAGKPTTSYVDVACRLRAALATLPDTYEGIAHMLSTHKVRGFTCRSDADPLANYLTTFVGHAVFVGPSTICATEGMEWSLEVGTPRAVRMFVAGFDAGEWPHLVTPEN